MVLPLERTFGIYERWAYLRILQIAFMRWPAPGGFSSFFEYDFERRSLKLRLFLPAAYFGPLDDVTACDTITRTSSAPKAHWHRAKKRSGHPDHRFGRLAREHDGDKLIGLFGLLRLVRCHHGHVEPESVAAGSQANT
jgi:hypothetical protein